MLDEWLFDLGLANVGYRETAKIFGIVMLTSMASFLSNRVFIQLEKQCEKTHNLWDDTLLWAARRPMSVLVWLLGISIAAHVAELQTESDIFSIVEPIRRLGIIILLCWFIVRFISGAEKIVVSPEKMKQPMDETTVSAMGKLLRLSVIITTVLVVLQSMGYSISGVLAFGGIGGIAVGFAAKDLLANFFGGLMIYLDRPFKVGDWIRSPDQQIEGTVEQIGWRLTTIRTFDKRPLYVPNSTFTSISVQNPSRMTHRRIYETLGIRYCDSLRMEQIVDDIKAMLIDHPEIDNSQTLIVNFNEYSASSLNFFVYTFTKTTNWIRYHEVKQDVLLKIFQIVENHGAEFAFPTSTVHLPDLQARELPQFAGIEEMTN